MQHVNVRLEGAEGTPETGFQASLEIQYADRVYHVRLQKLARRPVKTRHRMEKDHLVIELLDDKEAIIATCCIHKGHLDKGCMECPSLLVPPRETSQQCK